MAEDANTAAGSGSTHRFVWVADGEPVRGGQWVDHPVDGPPVPVSLADAVAARDAGAEDPIQVHVQASRQVVEAAGELEDRVFPEPITRLQAALVAEGAGEPPLDPESHDGMEVRLAAEALEKLAADLAELVQEQLDGGSLARLPPETTTALCQTVQAGWRLRRLVDPPGPLAL